MQRKVPITIDEEIYRDLQEQVGEDHISDYIEDLIRPHLVGDQELQAAYQAMAADTDREHEAIDWSEGLIGQTLP